MPAKRTSLERTVGGPPSVFSISESMVSNMAASLFGVTTSETPRTLSRNEADHTPKWLTGARENRIRYWNDRFAPFSRTMFVGLRQKLNLFCWNRASTGE